MSNILIWQKLEVLEQRISSLVSGAEHISKQLSEANVARDTQFTALMETLKMIHETTEAKLQEISSTLATELEEIKAIIAGGNDPAAINARLDNVITAIRGMSDVLNPTPGPSDTGAVGAGGSGEAPA